MYQFPKSQPQRYQDHVQNGHLDRRFLPRRASLKPSDSTSRSSTNISPRRLPAWKVSVSAPSLRKPFPVTKKPSPRVMTSATPRSTPAVSISGVPMAKSTSLTRSHYKLQKATRLGDYAVFKEYSEAINNQSNSSPYADSWTSRPTPLKPSR